MTSRSMTSAPKTSAPIASGRRLYSVIFAALLPISLGVQAGESTQVDVQFLHPEKYTDADYGRGFLKREGEAIFAKLRIHLQREAPKFLQSGQRLRVQFTDIDLAGDHEPHASIHLRDVRIIRSIYPPKLNFRYQLTDELGAVLREGDASIRDLGFDLHQRGRLSDSLRFEKRILDEWLRREFGPS